MEKQIIRQKGEFIYFDDGTKETIADYRKRLNIKKIDHSKKYDSEEQAERDRIMCEIIKFDKSAGMTYVKDKGFLRDENGKYIIDEETAKETLSGFTTRELKRIEKDMIAARRAKNV